MIIALWSAPRCRSTAFLRMMMERGDFTVLHEPFAHVADFGETVVGGRVVRSEQALIEALHDLGATTPLFFKDTTDFHYPRLLAARGFLDGVTHTFLIRHPRAAIASHHALAPELGRDEIGFARLHEIYTAVWRVQGEQPLILDSDDLLARPEAAVREYCRRVSIPFDPAALSWSPGIDDAWRRTARWHRAVSASGGFERRAGGVELDVEAHPTLGDHYRYHLPFYLEMHAARMRV